MNNAKTLMVQGTTSDAGKSVLVAGLCRWLANKQTAVVPFKPQNMALNSAVTDDAGEIGRAQAVQAQACFLAPHTDMNPILLKPSSDTGAQVIVHGKALTNMEARSYHDYKTTAMQAVLQSHKRLQEKYEVIVVEGAGSPAEINLRKGDIANMGFAEAVDCPVIIVADIDKGGVFAHLVGTLALLSESEQQRVIGFVINRFRGDIALLQPGLDWLEQKTGKPVIGVVPYLHDFFLDAEDAIESSQVEPDDSSIGNELADSQPRLNVVVPVLSRMSNHTDFDALRLRSDVNLQFVSAEAVPPACDLIILPGSKNVRADMAILARNNWPEHIKRHLRYGGKLLGICGGYQMLGQMIHDPEGIEQSPGSIDGFGFIDAITELRREKALLKRRGQLSVKLATANPEEQEGASVEGYEIHCGRTQFDRSYQPLMHIDADTEQAASDGVLSDDGQIAGTYLHGLFDKRQACDALLSWAGLRCMQPALDLNAHREQQLERLAKSLQESLDFGKCGPDWQECFS